MSLLRNPSPLNGSFLLCPVLDFELVNQLGGICLVLRHRVGFH